MMTLTWCVCEQQPIGRMEKEAGSLFSIKSWPTPAARLWNTTELGESVHLLVPCHPSVRCCWSVPFWLLFYLTSRVSAMQAWKSRGTLYTVSSNCCFCLSLRHYTSLTSVSLQTIICRQEAAWFGQEATRWIQVSLTCLSLVPLVKWTWAK